MAGMDNTARDSYGGFGIGYYKYMPKYFVINMVKRVVMIDTPIGSKTEFMKVFCILANFLAFKSSRAFIPNGVISIMPEY